MLQPPGDRREPNKPNGIPEFDPRGLLPPGIHKAAWAEVAERFGRSGKRRKLLDGLRDACRYLQQAGVDVLYWNGSFVTDKSDPADYDACRDMEASDVDIAKLPACLHPGHLHPPRRKELFQGGFYSLNCLRPCQYAGSDPNPKGVAALNLSTVTHHDDDPE